MRPRRQSLVRIAGSRGLAGTGAVRKGTPQHWPSDFALCKNHMGAKSVAGLARRPGVIGTVSRVEATHRPPTGLPPSRAPAVSLLCRHPLQSTGGCRMRPARAEKKRSPKPPTNRAPTGHRRGDLQLPRVCHDLATAENAGRQRLRHVDNRGPGLTDAVGNVWKPEGRRPGPAGRDMDCPAGRRMRPASSGPSPRSERLREPCSGCPPVRASRMARPSKAPHIRLKACCRTECPPRRPPRAHPSQLPVSPGIRSRDGPSPRPLDID